MQNANRNHGHAGRVRRDQLIQLARDQGFACAYCGHEIQFHAGARSRVAAELDHVEPTRWGGANAIENLVWACHYCNRYKGQLRAGDWLLILPNYRGRLEREGLL